MEPVTISVLGLGGLAAALAGALAVADKYLRVESDPRTEAVIAALPGVNCGGCGKPGCQGYAIAVVKGEMPPDKCGPGGAEAARHIAQIMGVHIGYVAPRVAVVHCRAVTKLKKVRAKYVGPSSCRIAQRLGGQYECTWGCLGLGDCAAVCPMSAIRLRDGLPFVDPTRCTACGKCVAACPRGIVSLQAIDEAKGLVAVLCRSKDRGAVAKKACDVACIACGICNKKSAHGLFAMVDNIAVPDEHAIAVYPDEADQIASECPKGCIQRMYVPAQPKRRRASDADAA